MRLLVLLLGLAAAAGSLGGAGLIFTAINGPNKTKGDAMVADSGASPLQTINTVNRLNKENVAGFNGMLFFAIGSILALFGSILAVTRRKKSAALLFIAAAIGPPVVLYMSDLQNRIMELLPSFGAAGFLAFVGLLALLIKPKPAPDA